MTRTEFAAGIAYLEDGSGKKLPTNAVEVYFDCLGDLDFEVFKLGAKRVLMEHKFANFPTIAELREASTTTAKGEIDGLLPAKAWELAWSVADTDLEVAGSWKRNTEGMPPLVLEAIEAYGRWAFCYSKDPVGVIRAQFLKIFEQLAARDKRRELLPPSLTKAIEGHPEAKRLAAQAELMNQLAGSIGLPPSAT